MYNGDVSAVDALISRKKALGHYREHPDFPGNSDFTLFYVADLDEGLLLHVRLVFTCCMVLKYVLYI